MNLIEVYHEFLVYCGCKDADRYTAMFKLIGQYEKDQVGSEFAYSKSDQKNVWNRSRIVRSYKVAFWNLPKKWFCNLWLVLQELDHYAEKHQERIQRDGYWRLRSMFDFCSRFFKGAIKIIKIYENTPIERRDIWL